MKRTSIREVAKLAKVSRQTVSRVLNGKTGVSDKTRQRVQKIIDDLNYIPAQTSSIPFARKTGTLGLVIADITNPFFSGFSKAVLDQANNFDRNVLLANTNNSAEQEMKVINNLAKQPVDGIIVFSNRCEETFLRKVAKPWLPLVLVNRPANIPSLALVLSDNHHGGRLAAEHLLKQGCHEFGFIGRADPSRPSPDIIRRFKGYRDVLSNHGYDISELNVELSTPDDRGGYDATIKLLRRRPETNGLFCYNDYMAFGAFRACKDLRVRVPGDIRIIGFDGVKMGDLVEPGLTTVDIDEYTLGQRSFEQLNSLLEQPEGSLPPVWVKPTLLLRGST